VGPPSRDRGSSVRSSQLRGFACSRRRFVRWSTSRMPRGMNLRPPGNQS
jgi:hypothetical protein